MTVFEPLELMKPQQVWNSTWNFQLHHPEINYQEKDNKRSMEILSADYILTFSGAALSVCAYMCNTVWETRLFRE